MNADETLDEWQQQIDRLAQAGRGASVQIRVLPEDVLEVFKAYGCPDYLKVRLDLLAERTPTHLLFRPVQLKAFLDHGREAQARLHPADVPRRRKARVDDQADVGAD